MGLSDKPFFAPLQVEVHCCTILAPVIYNPSIVLSLLFFFLVLNLNFILMQACLLFVGAGELQLHFLSTSVIKSN